MKTSCYIGYALLGAIALAAAHGVASAERLLTVRDQATGQTKTLTAANASFSMSEVGDTLNIAIAAQSPSARAAFIGNSWFLKFAAPPGEKLRPGQYENAGCPGAFRTGRAPSLEVTENNPICRAMDAVWGNFVIRQIAYDAAGKANAIELTFKQRAGSADAAPLTGLLRLDTAPLSLALDSDPGFAWGSIAQKNFGDSSLFSLTGTTAGLDYTASVIKDRWSFAIEPPTGLQLQEGRLYTTRNFADGPHAGLLILRGPQPQSCHDASGSLRIRKMDTDPTGNVLGLHAEFEYRCGGTAPALRGTIRYHK